MTLIAPSPRAISRKNTMVLCGHSFISNNSSADTTFGTATPTAAASYGGNGVTNSKGVFERAQILLGHPFTVVSNQGITGQTSTQILARFSTVLAFNPGWIYLDIHSNDYSNSISAATSINNTLQMIQAANNANIQVILALDIPRAAGYTQANIQALLQVSNYFKDYAITNPGVIVFDQWPYFLDTTSFANSYNGVPLSTTVLSDNIHPNAYGAGLAAQGLANLLKPVVPVVRRRSAAGSDGGTNGDLQIITRNPLMLGTGGSVGTGSTGTWAQNTFSARLSGTGIAGVGSIVTRASVAATFPGLFDDGAQGSLQAIALSGAAAATDTFYMSVSPVTNAAFAALAGTGPYVVEAEIGVNMTTGTVGTVYAGLSASVTSANWLCSANYNADAGDYLGLTKFQGVIRTRPFYLPSDTNSSANSFAQIVLGTSAAGAGTAYIGNFAMRKLLA